MKKLQLTLCSLLLVALLSACASVTSTGTSSEASSSDAASDAAAPNELTVMDWAGYDLPEFFEPFTAAHPEATVNYTYMEQDSDAFAKMQSGFEVDIVHVCDSWWGVYVENKLVEPIDTSRLGNWDELVPQMAELANFDGETFFVPWEWGYDSILVRTDKVDNVPTSWADLWNPEYAGHLAIADMPEANRLMTALALGFDDPWNLTPEETEQVQQKLIELKQNVLTYWVDSTELSQLMASGDIWIASNVWPDIYGTLEQEGVAVEYVQPEEGRIGWLCGYAISKDAQNVDLAYDFLNALIAPQSMANMANMYWYGAANLDAVPLLDETVLNIFNFDEPGVLEETNFYRPMSDAQRQEVTRMWDAVKASQ